MNINDFNKELIVTEIPMPNDGSNYNFVMKELYLYKEDCYSMKSQKLNLSKTKYIPKQKDKLYFYPGCNVPRYKVREWGKKNNISITINSDKANVSFGSANSINKCFSYDTYLVIEVAKFIDFLDDHYTKDSGNINELYAKLQESGRKYVYLQRWGTSTARAMFIKDYRGGLRSQAINDGFKTDLTDITKESYFRAAYLNETNYNVFNELLNSDDIYSQEDIIGLINEDALTIDSDMYKTLGDMFKSNNASDRVMALEIIANCNINPSLHFVLLLIKEFSSVIYQMRESKHVNFKSLLEYLDLNRNSMYAITEDTMMTSLMSKDVLTEKVMKELANNVKEMWKESYDSTHFKINTITVSDEVKDYFKRKAELETETI